MPKNDFWHKNSSILAEKTNTAIVQTLENEVPVTELKANNENAGKISSVARVPCALGQEIFLSPCQQLLQRLK